MIIRIWICLELGKIKGKMENKNVVLGEEWVVRVDIYR